MICSTRSVWRSLAEGHFGRCNGTFVGVVRRREPPLGRERSSGGSSFLGSEVELGRQRVHNDFSALRDVRDPGQAVVIALAIDQLVLRALSERTIEAVHAIAKRRFAVAPSAATISLVLTMPRIRTLPREKPATDSSFSAPKCGSTLVPGRASLFRRAVDP